MVGPKGYGVGIIMVYRNLVVKLILDCVGQLQVGIGLEYQGVSKESITLIVVVWGKITPIRHIMHGHCEFPIIGAVLPFNSNIIL